MKHIIFKRVAAKNFLSIGNDPICIDIRPGVNLITGINHDKEDSRNAAGKSTILEIINFALYGSTIRDIGKDYIQNTLTKGICEASLELQITSNSTVHNYTITRKLNPTRCELLKDGTDITLSTLAKTNEFIQKLINTSQAVFQNSIILSLNSTPPFMALSKVEKRKFIESILNLEVFSAMLSRARDEYSERKRFYELKYNESVTIQNSLSFNKDQLRQYTEAATKRVDVLKTKITSIKEKISGTKLQIKKVADSDLKGLDKLQLKYTSRKTQLEASLKDAQKQKTKIETKIEHQESLQKEYEESSENCPTCKRKYTAAHIKHIEEKKNSIQEKIRDLKKDLESIQKTKAEIKKDLRDDEEKLQAVHTQKSFLVERSRNNTTYQERVDEFEMHLRALEEELEESTKETDNSALALKIQEQELALAELNTQVTKANSDLQVLDVVKFVISEEGVKSYIVKKILKVLNSRLAFYLNELQANGLCQFNEFFEETVLDERGQPRSYFNFSGGEKKRIDLACLFAFLDVRRMQGDVNFSTIFYDELLDSSLDDRGIALTMQVLRERQRTLGENCYIITHRSTAASSKADHMILVEKRNGITYLS